MTFAFDEQFAMFDITPVENQFILEYMPGAKGEYVKVYLYGLLSCYHPKKEMEISSMCHELGLTEDEVKLAFRYWERKGIVRRVRDNPPEWQYINIKQKSLQDEEAPEPDYVQFSRDLENCFDGIRDFHGSEVAACYEWKETLGLPTEVILMLLRHMKNTRGKNFRVRDAEKIALELSGEQAFSLEDAEHVLARDEAINDGFRKVLRKLGMRFNPSDANLKLYRKWREDWHFTQEAIEDACDRTGTSSPSLAVVDAILEKTHTNIGDAEKELGKDALDTYEQLRKGLKEVLYETGYRGSATPSQQKQYSQMTALYPQKIILLAARECAAKQRSLDSVLKLLQSWKERGFTDEGQIKEHIEAFHGKEEFLRSLRQKWPVQSNIPGQKTMQMLDKWEDELGFSREMISLAADYAFEAQKPVSYMDTILRGWAEKGISTQEQAVKERKNHDTNKNEAVGRSKVGKPVNAQLYQQRDYSQEQDEAMRRMLDMDGRKSHA